MCWRHELHCLGFINDGNVMLNHGWWEVSLIQNVSLECENMSADDNINQNCSENILCHRSLSAQPISTRKAQLRKQIPQTFAHLVNFSKNVSSMFDNHTILLFWLQNKQTFLMFSLLDLCFFLCSLDLDVLHAQRIMGFFILITHKSTRSENPIRWFFSI